MESGVVSRACAALHRPNGSSVSRSDEFKTETSKVAAIFGRGGLDSLVASSVGPPGPFVERRGICPY
jgi:hypothetical protein